MIGTESPSPPLDNCWQAASPYVRLRWRADPDIGLDEYRRNKHEAEETHKVVDWVLKAIENGKREDAASILQTAMKKRFKVVVKAVSVFQSLLPMVQALAKMRELKVSRKLLVALTM